MTIEQVARRLNVKAVEGGFQIALLPELRKKHLNKSQLPATIFTGKTIFSDYAYHHGGRDEIQFNFGEESVGGKAVTRWGLCFSLDPSPSLHDPVLRLQPFKDIFNECFEKHPDWFNGFDMWFYQNGERHRNRLPQPISSTLFKQGTFIVLGKLINKSIERLTESDLAIILGGFDRLWPIYDYCVLKGSSQTSKENRITRLCWNLNGWVLPSGSQGKSKDKKSHEYLFGFGHEEWLFDTSKIINGFHYGFLEPVRKQQSAYESHVYDVWLYSLDNETKKRHMIGKINDLQIVDSEMAEEIWIAYKGNGWLKEMKQQLTAVGAKHGNLDSGPGIDIFNVRYRVENLHVSDQYIELSTDNPIYRLSRYIFGKFKAEYESKQGGEFHFQEPDHTNNSADEFLEKKKHLRGPKEVEITFLHRSIAKGLTKHLREIHGWKNVKPEHLTEEGGRRIDIVVREETGLVFYEIKTYNSLRTSVREAVGQLMEYSLWTNHNRAKRMVVITQPHADISEAESYFKHLRQVYSLPLYFETYDCESDVLSEEF